MRVSIFMFCLNASGTIRRAIESVLAQNFDELEFVVQDGVSTDGTLEILSEYGDRIDVASEPDSCPGEAFFKAVERCTGDLVGSCLADEELMPGTVAAAVEAFEGDEEMVALTRDAILTDLQGKELGRVVGRGFSLEEYLKCQHIPHFSASFFRGQSLRECGILRRPWRMDCGEFELWSRLLLRGPVRYLQGFASKYALHDGQLSRRRENVRQLTHGRFEVLDTLFRRERHEALRELSFGQCVYGNARSFGNELWRLGDAEGFRSVMGRARELMGNLGNEWIGESGSAPRCVEATEGRRSAPRCVEATEGRRSARRCVEGTGGRGSARAEGSAEGAAASSLAAYGEALYVSRRYEDCRRLAMLGEALGVDSAGFMTLRAKASLALNDPEEADATLEQLRSETGDDERVGLMFHEMALLRESRGEIDEAIECWDRAWVLPYPHIQSLALTARLKSPRATLLSLLEAHDRWAERFVWRNPLRPPLRRDRLGANGRLRVGVSCSFWSAATIRFQFLSFLRHLDPGRFEIIAYANFDDGFTDAPGVARVKQVGHLSEEEFMLEARKDELDILLELNGHSPRNRFAAMAMRCAPIQVSYLNYTGTSGVREIDYLIADETACGREEDPYYRESIFRLPGCFFCFNYEGDDPLPPGDVPSLQNGYITFGYFGSPGKASASQIELFAKTLEAVPGSKLLIRNQGLDSEENRARLEGKFAALGICAERLLLGGSLPRREVLKEYAKVDISLDTWPYNGGNTIAESLWQGVPVVTWRGDRFSARYGASLLQASGCADLVGRSPREYVSICARLAADEGRRSRLRRELPGMMKEHGFSDTEAFALRFGRALEEMVERYHASRRFYESKWGQCEREETRFANLFRRWVFVTTMPRSGTWYTKYVFHLLDNQLAGRSHFSSPPHHLRYYEGLGLNALHSHSGHWSWGDGEEAARDTLCSRAVYLDAGYNFGLEQQREIMEATGQRPPTIYIYRNPFDQCLSKFRHMVHHIGGEEGSGATSASQYFRQGGLESYLKQFYTHYRFAQREPEGILMLRYEDLVARPREGFGRMLRFALGRPLIGREMEALEFAVEAAAPENLKAVERLSGAALGRDQKSAKESHMRGGLVGGWRDHFGSEDARFLIGKLTEWEVPQSLFDFGSPLEELVECV